MSDKYRQWVVNAQRVRARYLTGDGWHGEGTVISYQDQPTVGIRNDRGQIFDWRADLCEPVDSLAADEARKIDLARVAAYVVDGKRYHPADVQIVLREAP